MRRERRLYPRYFATCELTGRPLLQFQGVEGDPPSVGQQIRGEVSNVSAGGLCLFGDNIADVSQPLRCQIKVPQLPIGIPTLLQVRWVHSDDGGKTYRLGLQFLL